MTIEQRYYQKFGEEAEDYDKRLVIAFAESEKKIVIESILKLLEQKKQILKDAKLKELIAKLKILIEDNFIDEDDD
jgi:hypothetical protein